MENLLNRIILWTGSSANVWLMVLFLWLCMLHVIFFILLHIILWIPQILHMCIKPSQLVSLPGKVYFQKPRVCKILGNNTLVVKSAGFYFSIYRIQKFAKCAAPHGRHLSLTRAPDPLLIQMILFLSIKA